MNNTRSNAKILSRSGAVLLALALVWGIGGDAQAAQSYQYYKFTPVVRRGANPDYIIQFSELQVSLNGTRIPAIAGITGVTNPHGNNPGNEGPTNLNDNSVGTKALDFNDMPVTGVYNSFILNMGSPILITEYRWATANDEPGRDPITWDFSGSNDPVNNFTLLDRQTQFSGIVNDPGRQTYLPSFSIVRVNSVNPTSGAPAGGTNVTITGSGFQTGATVTFGGVVATNIQVVSPTSITCTTPAGTAGATVNVNVTNQTGATDFITNGYTFTNIALGTITWKGTTDSKWSTATNWDLGRAPTSGDTIVLTGVGFQPSNLDIPNLGVTGLTFNATTTTPITVTPSGTATGLTLISPLTVDTAGADHIFAGDLVLNSPLVAQIGVNRIFTISGVVSGIAANTLTVAGAGTLSLTNSANTYLGATIVNTNATLRVTSISNVGTNGSLGASSTALNLNGGTLAYNGPTGATNRPITLNANSVIGVGTSNLTLNGYVSGNFALTKNGTGTLTLSIPNSYTGTTVNAGTLVSSVPGAMGTGTVTVNGTGNLVLGTGSFISGISGFGVNGTGWSVNGPSVNNDVALLTDGGLSEARTLFYSTPVQNIASGFVAQFVFNGSNGGADGATFTVQNASPTAVGTGGGGSAYGGISPSFALELNIYSPNNIGYSYGTNGAVVTPFQSVNPVALTGNDVTITVTYNGSTIVTRFDQAGNTFTTPPFAVNLSNLLGSTNGYVGFTGGTGGVGSTQSIKNFTLNPITPTYSNNIVANGAQTISVAATAASPSINLGTLTTAPGAQVTINANATTPPDQAYSIGFGAVTLNGNATLNVANNGAGKATMTAGPVGETTPSILAKGGTGTLLLTGNCTYSGATNVTGGTLGGTATLTSSAINVNTATVAPGLALTTGTLTGQSADFSAAGTLAVRVKALAQDQLVLNSTTTVPALKMGGTSTLIVDMTGYLSGDPDGSYVVATTPSWTTGTTNGFKNFNVINNTSTKQVRLSYNSISATSKQVIVNVGASVTPVRIEAFAATLKGAGVLLSWNAVSEFQNVGFNLYRRSAAESEWARVNSALIAGRITNPDAKAYAFYDWASAGEWQYKLESVSVSGMKETHEFFAGPVAVDWTSSMAEVPTVDVDSLPAIENGLTIAASVRNAERVGATFDSIDARVRRSATLLPAARSTDRNDELTSALKSERHAAEYCSVAPDSRAYSASARWFSASPAPASNRAAKVLYSNPGVMLIPQASLPAGFDIRHVSIQREGRSVNALTLVPGGLLVYAPGYQDDYTDKDALFLRKISGATPAGQFQKAENLFTSAQPVKVTSPATASVDYHDVYFDFNQRPYSFPPWFSAQYLAGGTTQSFALNTPSASNGAATLTISLWSLTESAGVSPDHALQVTINDQPIGSTIHWDGGNKALQLSLSIPSGVLINGSNRIDLITPAISGIDSQISFLHSLSIDYTRALDGSSPFQITNAAAASELFEIYNVPGATAWVVDTRFTDRPTLVPVQTQPDANGTWRLRFVTSAGGKYLFVPAGQENAPLSVSARQVGPVRTSGMYLATGPSQFSAGVQPLLVAHTKEGIRSQFVDQEQLFDYYNFGRFGPTAIQSAVRATRPQYLLLLGRTTYDYRNYGGANVDPLCPAFLVGTSFWAQTTSDAKFGDLGRGYPEVAVGRLPVNDGSELRGAVGRIVNYKGAPASGVRMHAVADAVDPDAGNFGQQLAGLAQNHPELSWQANTLGDTYQTAPEVTAAMTDAASGGADVILYNGHGNSVRLGKTAPRILDTETVQNWTGNVVFLQSTCAGNWVAKNETGFKSIAIQALTQPQGGISACIGTSTYMNSDVGVEFMNQLIKNTGKTGLRWGSALMSTQRWALQQAGNSFYQDIGWTEQLFGDPAMPIFMKSPAAKKTGVTGPAALSEGGF